MKIKEGFVMREVAGQSVVIALGEASLSYNGMIKLNDSARLIWQGLEKGYDREGLLEAVLEEYDVGRERAEADIDAFIATLTKAGVLE